MKEPSLYEEPYIKDRHFPIHISLKHYRHTGSIFPSHWHEAIEILYIMEGTVIIECSADRFTVSPGDIVVINANELHRGESMSNEGSYYCIDMSTNLLKGGVTDLCEIKYIEPIDRNLISFNNIIRNDPEVALCIRHMITEFERKEHGYEMAIKGNTYNLLTLLMRGHIQNIYTPREHDLRQRMFHKLKNALIYIENHFHEKMTLDILAAECGFSLHHFCHEFKKYTGKSPGEYITSYRIAKAEDLLVNSHMNITEVAYTTGFGDANYFARAFRKFKNDSPSTYRRKNRFSI